MARLDLSDGFGVHDSRSGLKLRRQDAGSMTLTDREGLDCPACGEAFERLFVGDDETATFASAPTSPIYPARTDERLLVLAYRAGAHARRLGADTAKGRVTPRARTPGRRS